MAKVLQWDFFNVGRGDTFRIIPIGDVHIGSKATDEDLLKKVVASIAKDKNTYWIGMGDYCEFINLRDPRFSSVDLASWIDMADLLDLAKAQRDRYLGHTKCIAHKCLALVKGNHENSIQRHTERAIYEEIVAKTKEYAKFPATKVLGVGTYGWLILRFYRGDKRSEMRSIIRINLHHGFVGGKLKGAKGLNMQRWLWSHECDLALFGHSHNADAFTEAIERVGNNNEIIVETRRGAYCGTFRKSVAQDGETYSEIKGYFPLPLEGVEVLLRPGARDTNKRVRLLT